jgi:hypothetical protein
MNLTSRCRLPVFLLVSVALGPGCDPAAADGAPLVDAAVGRDADPVTGTCVPASGPSDAFVDCVDEVQAAPGASFGHDALPDIVLGPPVGGTPTKGSMDVASLGCEGRITLSWDGPALRDGPGPDFIVFENAFVSGDESFAEPARVLVSADGEQWFGFPCDPTDGWPADGCAGVGPTQATNAAEAADPEAAGGDAFDLADIGVSEIRWVRLVDVTREYYGNETWCAGAAAGFDLDAIAQVAAP